MLNPFTFCISEDSQLLSIEIEMLLKNAFPKMCSIERKTYWGTEELPTLFWDTIQTASFFTNPHIIILRKANELSPTVWKTLSNVVSHIQADRILFFFIESKLVPKHIKELPCYQHARAKKWIIEKTKLTKQTIPFFIQQYITSKGFHIERKTLEYLSKVLPQDAYAITTELDKMMIYSDGSTLSTSHLDTILSYTPEHTIWNLLDIMQDNKNISSLLSTVENTSFFLFSSLLQKDLCVYIQFIMGEPPNLAPFLYKQKEKIASSLNIENVQTIFSILSETEYKIKIGNITEKQALEYALISIQKIFSTHAKKDILS
ncbi:MAG: DNA polymerase III subunit delta [Desulfovibrionaceae bacterium]